MSYTTSVDHSHWHRCLCGLRIEGKRSTLRNPIYPPWWPHNHLTCDAGYRTPHRCSERPACYHCASQLNNWKTLKS